MSSVKQRQLNLKHCGYYYVGKIDNDEGPLTRLAYGAFQEDQKLKIDKVYGPKTEEALVEWVKDIQRALIKAGFKLPKYGADGQVGDETIKAIKTFQKANGLKVDGIIGDYTFAKLEKYMEDLQDEDGKVDWGKSRYFKKKEFKCPCGHCNGYPAEVKPKLLNLIEDAREHFNLPIHITSGLRCAYQNKLVGGIKNSKHQYGKAADCSLDLKSDNDLKLYKFFKSHKDTSYTYTGFGAVHVDVK
jgi:hypothetical protein